MLQASNEGRATVGHPLPVTVPLSLRSGALLCTAKSTGPGCDAHGTFLRLSPFSCLPYDPCPFSRFFSAQSKTRNKIWTDVPHRHPVVCAGKQGSAQVLLGARSRADLWTDGGES